jgi:hypothetical protein
MFRIRQCAFALAVVCFVCYRALGDAGNKFGFLTIRVCIETSHRFDLSVFLYALLILTSHLLRDIGCTAAPVLYFTLPYDFQPDHQDGIQVIDTIDTLVSRCSTTPQASQNRLRDGGSFVVTADEG